MTCLPPAVTMTSMRERVLPSGREEGSSVAAGLSLMRREREKEMERSHRESRTLKLASGASQQLLGKEGTCLETKVRTLMDDINGVYCEATNLCMRFIYANYASQAQVT